ncbi:movement protein [Abeliophyllum distichum]|uniref:Movement protein n=1 Tax=Abeliophyllum distichum TaxID=126358 RepID=A0ABD1TXI0_9LAMI
MSPKVLRSSPKNETLLIEINHLLSNVAIPRRLSWDQVTQNPLWMFENELPPVREAPNSRLKEIIELADGKEIVIPKGDVKVITSPLKQISDKGENDNPTIKDIKNIQQQNNYTNILLHSAATQLNQIEQPVQNELIKQDKLKGKENAYEKTSKTLFKPNKDKVHFGSGTSDVLLEIVKKFRDKETTKPRPPQKSFSGLEVIVWDIDGMTEHQIMQVISEMSMASSAYSAKGNTDKEAAVNIYNGFSGQLKNWWFNYISSDERDKILNAIKKEGDNHLDPSK